MNPSPESTGNTSSGSRLYSVPGISCDHCKRSIEDEVSRVGDVSRVTVDVDAKTVLIVGGADDEIRAAIDEAGFEVASVHDTA